MYKDFRFINAGENEFYRYGKKAQERVRSAMKPNERGYYSIIADGGKYWTIGTSKGKFGEFAKFKGTFFSVNNGGYVYAKVDTEKGDMFIEMLKTMLKNMIEYCEKKITRENEDEDEEN